MGCQSVNALLQTPSLSRTPLSKAVEVQISKIKPSSADSDSHSIQKLPAAGAPIITLQLGLAIPLWAANSRALRSWSGASNLICG